tara:strand:- start:69173 stop:69634 length:462 start_codon:yes stop_codon:yes gene_type:complete
MKVFKVFLVFLILNFGALAIGHLLMNGEQQSSWYLDFNKAPWTPPGWAFGVAWTFIMFCFSIYMTELYLASKTKQLKVLFAAHLVLNMGWSYIFFNQHAVAMGFVVLSLLTLLIFFFLISYQKRLKLKSLLILPYFSWLCVATSLNLYIVLNN